MVWAGCEALLKEGDKFSQEGKFSEVAGKFRGALKSYEASKEKIEVARSLDRLGKLAIDIGNYQTAVQVMGQARKLYQEAGLTAQEVAVLRLMGLAYDEWGDLPGVKYHCQPL